ncbi:unnamed protein product [Orchesella dallaii]|uniref:C2H2-type domain-containing protein n=1 Tax=Orchesella dallaii TaxID=48710 RepID=A0ABP1RZN6_9HEXA
MNMSHSSKTQSITLDSRGHCFLCLKKCTDTDYENNADTQDQQMERFCKLISRYLGMSYDFLKCEQNSSLKATPNRDDDFLNQRYDSFPQINISSSCTSCRKLVDKFCESYFQMKSLELQVEWQVRQLKSVLAFSKRAPNRQQIFVQQFQVGASGNDHDLGNIQRFRRKLLRKCSKKLSRTCPRIFLERQFKASSKINKRMTFSEKRLTEEAIKHVQIKSEEPEQNIVSTSTLEETSCINSESNDNVTCNQSSEAFQSQLSSDSIKIESPQDEESRTAPVEFFTPMVEITEPNTDQTSFIPDPLTEGHSAAVNPFYNIQTTEVTPVEAENRWPIPPTFGYSSSSIHSDPHSTNTQPCRSMCNGLYQHANSHVSCPYPNPTSDFCRASWPYSSTPCNRQPNHGINMIYQNENLNSWNSLPSFKFGCNRSLVPPITNDITPNFYFSNQDNTEPTVLAVNVTSRPLNAQHYNPPSQIRYNCPSYSGGSTFGSQQPLDIPVPSSNARDNQFPYYNQNQYSGYNKGTAPISSSSMASTFSTHLNSPPLIPANPKDYDVSKRTRKGLPSNSESFCKLCGVSVSNKLMSRHLLNEHGVKDISRPHRCEICNVYFKQKGKLIRHRKTMKHLNMQKTESMDLQQFTSETTEEQSNQE